MQDNAEEEEIGISQSSVEVMVLDQDLEQDSEIAAKRFKKTLGDNPEMAAGVVPQVLPEIKYEYLDHTADVQLHAWGCSLTEAFEQCAMGMFGYMTDIEKVDNKGRQTIEAQGHDMLSLLFGFLDEFLYLFNAEPNFIARKVNITSFDRENFKIKAVGFGETFSIAKHPQGTEVKAITYSNMQFHESEDYAEVFVIIDI